jgi:hypothetical protein
MNEQEDPSVPIVLANTMEWLKAECERQHARAEQAERALAEEKEDRREILAERAGLFSEITTLRATLARERECFDEMTRKQCPALRADAEGGR